MSFMWDLLPDVMSIKNTNKTTRGHFGSATSGFKIRAKKKMFFLLLPSFHTNMPKRYTKFVPLFTVHLGKGWPTSGLRWNLHFKGNIKSQFVTQCFHSVHPLSTICRTPFTCLLLSVMSGRKSRWWWRAAGELWISSTCSMGQTSPWLRPSASRTLTGGCAVSTAPPTAKVRWDTIHSKIVS